MRNSTIRWPNGLQTPIAIESIMRVKQYFYRRFLIGTEKILSLPKEESLPFCLNTRQNYIKTQLLAAT